MKRYINAYYVGEPSASEYGEFIDQAHKKMQERYYPFTVTYAYLSEFYANSSGYWISLPNGDTWVADMLGDPLHPKGYKLYGAYVNPKKWLHSNFGLKDDALATDQVFKSIDSIMTYLFETEGIEV